MRPALRLQNLAAFAGLILCAGLFAAPQAIGLDPGIGRAAALAAAAIVLWATAAVPEYLAALGFFLAAVLAEPAPPAVIFAGFSSTAFWLVFSGLVLAAAVDRTGLGRRLAAVMIRRMAGSYVRVIAGTVSVATGLAFLLPSTMGRVMLLVPVILALADRIGFGPGSRGRTGMVLAAVLGTYLVAAGILPANVANMVMAGAVDTIYGIELQYGPYLILHFPVLGIGKAVVLVVAICWLFPDRPTGSPELPGPEPLSPEGRRLGVVLAIVLVAWATDFLHGVSPAWVGLAAAIVCLVPASGLLPPEEARSRLNIQPLLYIAGVLGVAGLVHDSGLGAMLSRTLLAGLALEPGADGANFLSLAALATGLGLVTTVPGMPAIFTPLAADIAAATGWPLPTAVMLQVLGFSTVVLPYQLPPLMIGMALGGVRMRDGVRLTLVTAAASLLLLIPVNFFWWRWLDAFTG
ncbi:MAG: SLC13 family permease [Alphaproteobacteria bacterium]|nr:SLC13 family permease [Alphaproteobacteria bacterium]